MTRRMPSGVNFWRPLRIFFGRGGQGSQPPSPLSTNPLYYYIKGDWEGKFEARAGVFCPRPTGPPLKKLSQSSHYKCRAGTARHFFLRWPRLSSLGKGFPLCPITLKAGSNKPLALAPITFAIPKNPATPGPAPLRHQSWPSPGRRPSREK